MTPEEAKEIWNGIDILGMRRFWFVGNWLIYTTVRWPFLRVIRRREQP